jgi:drug/metabolite transporter (DMT)-like permease
MATILGFLVSWLIVFAVCFAVVEFGQKYLYDETTPNALWKVLGGSAILAALMTWAQASYDTMFTARLGPTVILAIAGFAVFTLAFRFDPWPAAAIGIPTAVVLAGLTTLVIDSMKNRGVALEPPGTVTQGRPLRVPAGGPPVAPGAVKAKP